MDTTKTRLTQIGLDQARNHPKAAARIGVMVGRHPRRAWKAVMLARYAQDAVSLARGVAQARRRDQARARRRARIRGLAIGMSVVGVGAGTIAGVKLSQSRDS
jgi:hypothetical protein